MHTCMKNIIYIYIHIHIFVFSLTKPKAASLVKQKAKRWQAFPIETQTTQRWGTRLTKGKTIHRDLHVRN